MFVLPVSRIAHGTYRPSAFNGHSLDAGRALDRLLNETIDRVLSAPATSRLPALDLHEAEHGYTVQVDLPGFAREDVKVSIDGKRVSIDTVAKKAADAEARASTDGAPRVLVQERSSALFSRSFSLPVEIDEAASQAKLENGVLTLTLAKKVKPASQLSIG